MNDETGRGILSGPIDGPWRAPQKFRQIEATNGLAVAHLGSRFSGRVVRVEQDGGVVLRSVNTGLERIFTLRPGAFALTGTGETVTLVRPIRSPDARPSAAHPSAARPSAAHPSAGLTPSGSVAVAGSRARVARASRILVEGVHDAELVERVWGEDLRLEGIVVERLDGVDALGDLIRRFRPHPGARLGVLVDHLVTGSKEWRIATALQGPDVRIAGTPYVDVWQAIKPAVVGLAAWPEIPKGRSWKEGICEAFGEPAPGRLWKRFLGQVKSYADLEPSLVGAMESLIDFVTTGT